MSPREKRTIRIWFRLAFTMPVVVAVVLLLSGVLNGWAVALILLAMGPACYALWRYGVKVAVPGESQRSPKDGKVSLLTPYAQSVIDILPDALVLVDANRRVIEANDAARQLFGVRLMGRDFSQILRHPRAVAAMEQAARTLQRQHEEITILSPGERQFILTAMPMIPRAHTQHDSVSLEIADVVAIALHEVTAMKQSEKLRADFVANASHELRTPLASLIGFIETLQGMDDDDPDARGRFLSIMGQEAARMSRLIDDLLSLSRIELDEHVSPTTEVDAGGVVVAATEALALKAAERSMTISADFEGVMIRVIGDADQLTQVFQNLIDNAIKYGREGGAIRIKARPVKRLSETGVSAVAFEVFNEGEGIAREHLPRLTDRFYRVDAARSRTLGSTGLGLAIVKHIVNRHRGRLTFDSELGVGTTVTVFLPLADQATDLKAAQ